MKAFLFVALFLCIVVSAYGARTILDLDASAETLQFNPRMIDADFNGFAEQSALCADTLPLSNNQVSKGTMSICVWNLIPPSNTAPQSISFQAIVTASLQDGVITAKFSALETVTLAYANAGFSNATAVYYANPGLGNVVSGTNSYATFNMGYVTLFAAANNQQFFGPVGNPGYKLTSVRGFLRVEFVR